METILYILYLYFGKYYLLLYHQQVNFYHSKNSYLIDKTNYDCIYLDIWGGWACFVVSIIIIGILTAVIGDLASHFGCTVGLKDSVTAISFVALGTSLPGSYDFFV